MLKALEFGLGMVGRREADTASMIKIFFGISGPHIGDSFVVQVPLAISFAHSKKQPLLMKNMQVFLKEDIATDITIHASDRTLQAHKLVLVSCCVFLGRDSCMRVVVPYNDCVVVGHLVTFLCKWVENM